VAAEQAEKERAQQQAAPPPPPEPPKPPPEPVKPVTDTPAAAMQRPTMVMGAATIEAALAAADELEGYKDDGKKTEMMAAVAVPDDEAAAGDTKPTSVMDAIDISMITGRASTEVGAAHADEDDEVEMSIEADDADGESSGEISGEIPVSPSGATEKSGANGKPRTRGGRSGKKRGKKR
jgi:hypothetical protein